MMDVTASRFLVPILMLLVLLPTYGAAETVATWDFSESAHGWVGNPSVEGLTVGAQGLTFHSTGVDPWIEGPAMDLPGQGLAKVTVHMKSTADTSGELFYGPRFEAGHSARFTVRNDGQWHDYTIIVKEPLGRSTRFRLDPAAGEGDITVRSIAVDTMARIETPPLEKPERPNRRAEPALMRSGTLSLEHHGGHWGDFIIKVDGVEMATGYHADQIGLMRAGEPEWLRLDEGGSGRSVQVEHEIIAYARRIVTQVEVTDSGSAKWRLTRRFELGPQEGTIVVEIECVVDQDRELIHLPWLTLFAGLETFGTHKTQGLLAGLEYLSDEPSSSQADLTTPEHVRRVPDPVKITFPLMAVASNDRYVGLIWESSDMTAAVFDSPDTVYNSGGHVMALTAPEVGPHRFENDFAAHTPVTLKANRPVKVRAVIVGGAGKTIIPAVQKYVQVKGFPDRPKVSGGFEAALKLLAHGWLDSAVNEGGRFRHAVWGTSFGAQPAADAPLYMDWLANHVTDVNLVERLEAGRDTALAQLPSGDPRLGAVSHVRTPAPPLVFGGVEKYVAARQVEARNLLRQFDVQGIKHYRPGKADYGKTHFADHANGLAAVHVARILEAATLSADPELVEQGLALLDKQTILYAGTVPRGAQTWEVPLHTPDILASAYMVKSYVLGHIISGRPDHLEQARYWAWTGVPFVYLDNPTPGKVGLYGTIAVLGATNWRAPIWLGQPVQWCGLVYASALHQLSQYDADGPWSEIARGITASGLQMVWPVTDQKRQGLLPDYFLLRDQVSEGPAINPGTVQAHVPELIRTGPLYDVRKFGKANWFVHAPCGIRDIKEDGNSMRFAVDGWGGKSYTVLISGVTTRPARVTVRKPIGRTGSLTAAAENAFHFNPQQNLLAIPLEGVVRVGIEMSAAD